MSTKELVNTLITIFTTDELKVKIEASICFLNFCNNASEENYEEFLKENDNFLIALL